MAHFRNRRLQPSEHFPLAEPRRSVDATQQVIEAIEFVRQPAIALQSIAKDADELAPDKPAGGFGRPARKSAPVDVRRANH